VIEFPKAKDLGYEDHLRLIETFKERNVQFHVVDSKDILERPEQRLDVLCRAVGIPFSKAMLHWAKRARKEDGIWAKHWYHSVHDSDSFQKPVKKPESEPREDLKDLIQNSQLLYQQIIKA